MTDSAKANLDPKVFEDEVRRVARQLWPEAEYSGSLMVAGQERDGIFETEDCIHIVEATTSRQKEKAVHDAKKLRSLAERFRRHTPTKAIKCWFVTRDEPTADQRTAILVRDKGLIACLSFVQFQAKLVDAASYLDLRTKYPFGSVRDPKSDSINPTIKYVRMDILQKGTGTLWSIDGIVDRLLAGAYFVLLGDYGAGKSMTLREIFFSLREKFLKHKLPCFPVYVNLRDHFGQTDPSEVLERHGRKIGYPNPHHLVRAWRAGNVVLLLDGFDEVTATGIQGLWKRMKDARYRAMEAVRKLINEHPTGVGLIVAGRSHFFDSPKEMEKSFGVQSNAAILDLADFNSNQIEEYLKHCGIECSLPRWLPSRPLLLGSLAARGLLEEICSSSLPQQIAPAAGWDRLLQSVANREARIEAGIDGDTIRRILERLATLARASVSGLGPISAEQIIQAFKGICGYLPDKRAMILLQRLPGLGVHNSSEESRIFVDEDFVDACRSGDLVQFVDYPFDFDLSVYRGCSFCARQLGIDLAVHQLIRDGYNTGKVNAALRKAADSLKESSIPADIARVCLTGGWDIQEIVYVSNATVERLPLTLEMGKCGQLQFHDCYFHTVEIGSEVTPEHLPRFCRCYVAEIEGRASARDLPPGVFDGECVFDSFSEESATTNAILESNLALGVKVLMTVLRKLYLQRGSGRRETALVRGLDHQARRLVPDVLRILTSEGLVSQYRKAESAVWLPDRRSMARVGRILSAPVECDDQALIKVRALD